jgi:hypothetical protein
LDAIANLLSVKRHAEIPDSIVNLIQQNKKYQKVLSKMKGWLDPEIFKELQNIN